MTRVFLSLIASLFLIFPLSNRAMAQETVWVQIEAQPSLNRTQESIRKRAAQLQDVNGFTLPGGWYAVALGPYTREQAEQVLRVLRAERLIPRDSYIAASSDFRQQFWPVGANLLNAPAPATADDITLPRDPEPQADPEQLAVTQPEATTQPEPTPLPEATPEPVDETPRQARASEAELSRDERAALQVALRWAGFYNGSIDAAFGRGTRGSMANWQEANGFEPTGILTTKQRAELLRQYNAVLEGLDLRLVRDDKAGIEIKLPMGMVELDRYEAPFAHYKPKGEDVAKVVLISQPGNQNTLGGLYDILQTLDVVPEQGERELKATKFTLTGEDSRKVTHTRAWLKDGEIKGFMLVWPKGDEERRTRLLEEMTDSFQRISGVLDPSAGALENQSIDLISGLEIRKPRIARSGFFVDDKGTVVTTAEAVQSCSRITIDEIYEAEVAAVDDALGIAVLRPVDRLSPMAVAGFQMAVPRLQSDVAVAGYSYGGTLGAPTMTFGRLADVRGLNGEEEYKRLALSALDGDAGGPVVDAAGGVLGMLLPAPKGDRQLPDGVSFAADADAVTSVLSQAGISPSAASENGSMAPEALTREATNMTVLVSCWE